MNEARWLAYATPGELLDEMDARDGPSERKFRLISCACARILWRLMPDACRRAVEVAERFAEGLATEADLDAACWTANAASSQFAASDPRLNASIAAWRAAWTDARGNHGKQEGAGYVILDIPMAIALERQPNSRYDPSSAIARETDGMLCDLIRCITGNLLRSRSPLSLAASAWNDGAVRKMAPSIYDARAFDRLPLLADAHEEAGCADPDILNHCRRPGPHARGCWVVDLILGKA